MAWSGNGNGLHFGDYGTILSTRTFKSATSQDAAACSVEIWLQPGLTIDTNTFLAFYTPDNPLQFSLHQSNSALDLRSKIRNRQHQTQTARLYIGNVFRRGESVFISITSDSRETAVYINGALVRKSRQFRFSAQNLAGELVVGNSPVENDSWSGILRGLAIYNEELTRAQVLEHYHTWTAEGRPQIAGSERNIALYLFSEQRGNIIRNQVSSGVDLYIPERYTVLNQIFLHPIWKEFSLSWSYWKNVLINISGFIPLGFIFCAFFSSVSRIKRPSILTTILGFTVSVTIEVLQAFLPTRDSGMSDIITNTLGTCIGVGLYRVKPIQALLAQMLDRLPFTPARYDPAPRQP